MKGIENVLPPQYNFQNLGANAHGVEQVTVPEKGTIGLAMLQRTILALIPLIYQKAEIWDNRIRNIYTPLSKRVTSRAKDHPSQKLEGTDVFRLLEHIFSGA